MQTYTTLFLYVKEVGIRLFFGQKNWALKAHQLSNDKNGIK